MSAATLQLRCLYWTNFRGFKRASARVAIIALALFDFDRVEIYPAAVADMCGRYPAAGINGSIRP